MLKIATSKDWPQGNKIFNEDSLSIACVPQTCGSFVQICKIQFLWICWYEHIVEQDRAMITATEAWAVSPLLPGLHYQWNILQIKAVAMNITYANHKAYVVLYLWRCEVVFSLTSFFSLFLLPPEKNSELGNVGHRILPTVLKGLLKLAVYAPYLAKFHFISSFNCCVHIHSYLHFKSYRWF